MSRCTSRWTLSSRNKFRVNIFQVTVCGSNSSNSASDHNSCDCERNYNGRGCAHNSYGTVRHNSNNSAGGHNSSGSVNIIPVM